MLVKKKDCQFRIKDHSVIKSPSGLRKELTLDYSDDSGNVTMLYTNIGFVPKYKFIFACPKGLYQHQAKNIIAELPEEFNLDT